VEWTTDAMPEEAAPDAMPEEAVTSDETWANFELNRHWLCKPAFEAERMNQRLQKRLRKSRRLPPPIVLRDLLSEEDIAEVFHFVDAVREGEATTASSQHETGEEDKEEDAESTTGDGDGDGLQPGSEVWLTEQMRLTALLNAVQDDDSCDYDPDNDLPEDEADVDDGAPTWVQCSTSHEKIFLHRRNPMRDGVRRAFRQACPRVLQKLIGAMHDTGLADAAWRAADSPHSERPPLHTRCVEFHSYTAGGGLLDPGHIDVGSTITLSVLLSDATPAAHGGRFSTSASDGTVTLHECGRGDAVVFCSEMVHNVQTVLAGVRNSLVIELWTDAENRRDRHH